MKSFKLYRNETPVKLAFQNALATFSQKGYAVASAIDGKVAPTNNGWAISPEVTKVQMASFETKQNLPFKGGSELTFTLRQQFQDAKHALGRFRLAVTDAERPVTFGVPPGIKAIFAIAEDKRNAAQKKKLVTAFQQGDSTRIKLAKVLAEARKPLPADPKINELKGKLTAGGSVQPLPAMVEP